MLIDHEEYQLPDMHYVPATIYYQSYGGLGIYVKWKGHGGHGCKVISQSGWNTHLLCPDREIFMVGNLNKLSNDISLGNWDEFIPVSLFHDMPQSKAQRGPEIFMVNAHQDKGREHVRHSTRSRPPMPTARKIIGDSGAFQMRTPGVFVDPATVRHFYNHNVDYGVVLDFPLWDGWHYDNLIRSAHIQARNTQIIMEGLYPHVNLINVVHGMRPKDRMDFLEIVHRPEITSFSTSNYGFGEGIVAFVYQMKALWDSTEEKYPGHYQHFHLLAMSESKLMFVMARMAATGLLGQLKITFDSSTHLHSANAKSYLHTNSGMQSLKRIGLGDDLNLFNSNQRLPCDCFAGETKFITDQGVKTLEETVGQKVNVLTEGGKWVKAEVKDFGVQELMKVTLTRNKQTKVVYATKGHRWVVSHNNRDRSVRLRSKEILAKEYAVTTDQLIEGDCLMANKPQQKKLKPSIIGIRHGFVFGDGTAERHGNGKVYNSRAYFHGTKDEEIRLKYFNLRNKTVHERAMGTSKQCRFLTGLPKEWKLEVPSLDKSDNYLAGFLAGLVAADGYVAGNNLSIYNKDLTVLEKVRDIATKLGIVTFPIRGGKREGKIVIDGKELRSDREYFMYEISFLHSTFPRNMILLKHHRDKNNKTYTYERLRWRVVSVEATDRKETVYCAVVPKTETFTLEDFILTGNCPVCGAVGWTDALNLSSMSGVSFFLSMHNVYATDQHFKSLLWYAQHKSLEDLIFLAGKLFPKGANAKIHEEVIAALNYIERIKDAGFEDANREFGFFIDYAFDDADEPPIEQEQSMFASAPVVDAEIAAAYSKGDEKPWSQIDDERMTEFENKITALSLGIRNFDSQKAVSKKRAKSRIKGPSLSGESSLTEEIKQNKRDKKKPEIAQKERKVTVATTARSASSFSKQKSKAKAAGKPKAETKVRGMKVVKSENRKRL